MKRYSLLFLVVQLFYVQFAVAQFRPGDIGFNAAQHEIYKKAKVKSQTEKLIDTTFGYVETPVSVSEFTTDGWLLSIVYMESLEESYDEEAETESSDSDAEPENMIRDEYTYFPDGRIRIISLYGYDLYPITYAFEYDKRNKLIASSIAAAEARKFTYEYDKSGNIIKRSGKANMFQYDDEGNLMEGMIWVDNEESVYTWNEKHQLLSEIFYMRGEFYYKILYTYNDNGQVSTQIVYYDTDPAATPAYSTFYTYNENNLPVKMVIIEEGLEMEYKYDYEFY